MTSFEQLKKLLAEHDDACKNRDCAWNRYNQAVDDNASREVIESLYIAAKDAEFVASEKWAVVESAKADYLVGIGFLAHV